MKIKLNRRPEGIVLAATLGVILVFAIILVGFMNLVNNQNSAVARSQSWNQAIPVLETGIEEGLTQLHLYGTNKTLLTNNTWTYGADGLYHKARTNSDGSYYTASIQITNNPIIISTGFVPVLGISHSVSRRVKVTAFSQPATPGGLNAKSTITFSGGKSYLDSFNSANSSNGLYSTSLRESNALALTDSTVVDAIDTGTGQIYGTANVGPGGTANGTITGGYTDNANVQFNDVSAPFTYGSGTPLTSLTSTMYQGTNYSYVLSGGNYDGASLTLSGASGTMAITGSSPTTLYINGIFKVQGSAYVYIAPGASLNMYVNGDATISGSGVVNGTQLASQCTIYGMTGCTVFKYQGGTAFIGTVYAPDAAFTYSGGADATGSFTASNVTVTGGANIHFDESLYSTNGYVVQTWNEF